jgi:hypothetical protein
MASSGPNSPGTIANSASGFGDDWANPSNAGASDNAYAEFTDSGFGSDYLKATNFGFAIDSGATINGIVAEFERKANSAGGGGGGARILDQEIKLVKAGTIQSTNKSAGATWPTTDTYASFGGAADLWSGTWTPSDINNSGFGVTIKAWGNRSDGSETGYVDHIRITVYYTVASSSTNPAALIGCI